MDSSQIKMSRKTVSLLGWVIVPTGIILAFVLSIWLTDFLFSDALTVWKSLGTPPSSITIILDADSNNVWVKTRKGQIFTTTLRCYENRLCKQWVEVRASSQIHLEPATSLKRSNNCEGLDAKAFPRNPDGVITDCVLAISPGPEYDFKTYYAVMSDGSIRYWRNEVSEYKRYFFCLSSSIVLSTIVVAFFKRIHRRVVAREGAG
jgi:hypothetical protein